MEIKDNNVIIPKEEYDRSTELSYITFVLGYDLLDDVLKKDSDVECDIAYDFCNGIATKFMGTEEYHNLRYSAYEMLDRWVNDNITEIITDYKDFSRIRKDEVEIYGDKEILEKGERNGSPIALVKWNKGGREEYLVAFEYKVTDDKLSWGYGYYYDNDIDKAKADFSKVINGGNLSDTFRVETVEYRAYITTKGNYMDFGESMDCIGYYYNYFNKDRVLIDGGQLLSEKPLNEKEIIQHLISSLEYSLKRNSEDNIKFEDLRIVDDFEEAIPQLKKNKDKGDR